MSGHVDALSQVTTPGFSKSYPGTTHHTNIFQDPFFLARHEIWILIRGLLDQDQRSRRYQEQLESSIREGRGAYYQLHAYCAQMEKRASDIEHALVLEERKVKELDFRVSSLNSLNAALLHHMASKDSQAQDPRNRPVSTQEQHR